MQRWEYLHLEAADNGVYLVDEDRQENWQDLTLHEVLNLLGAEGWELTTAAYEQAIMLPCHLIFKRPC